MYEGKLRKPSTVETDDLLIFKPDISLNVCVEWYRYANLLSLCELKHNFAAGNICRLVVERCYRYLSFYRVELCDDN